MTREEKLAELRKREVEARKSPEAFINHFCWTFDPKRDPYHFPFKLFPFQETLLVPEVAQAVREGHDLFIDKTREMGATYCILDVFLWFWLFEAGSNFLLGSRKQDLVDNTRGNDSSNKEESLFGKIDYTLNRLPKFLLPRGWNPMKHFTFMSIINPENGNVISGESSNPSFSRGARYKAIMMDEFAFWDNDSAAWGSTADTTNSRIVLTTPGIRPSKAKRLRFGKDGEKIQVLELPYHLDPRKNAEWIRREKERRSAEDFAREIMMNWDTSVVGRVYTEIETAEVGNYPYIPDYPLYVSWDFGLDGIAIQWWQKNMANGKYRIVEAYSESDKPIHYTFPLFPGNPVDSTFQYSHEDLELFRMVSRWKKAIHFGDPDVAEVRREPIIDASLFRLSDGRCQMVAPLPAVAVLSPAVDFWTEIDTVWKSPVTRVLEESWTNLPAAPQWLHQWNLNLVIPWIGRLGIQAYFSLERWIEMHRVVVLREIRRTTETEKLGTSYVDLQYLRQIEVQFALTGLAAGETITDVVFGGTSVAFSAP